MSIKNYLAKLYGPYISIATVLMNINFKFYWFADAYCSSFAGTLFGSL
jgi:hypothetical protein